MLIDPTERSELSVEAILESSLGVCHLSVNVDESDGAFVGAVGGVGTGVSRHVNAGRLGGSIVEAVNAGHLMVGQSGLAIGLGVRGLGALVQVPLGTSTGHVLHVNGLVRLSIIGSQYRHCNYTCKLYKSKLE